MKIFNGTQLEEAQAHKPQIERFVGQAAIYVVESPDDYEQLPTDLRAMVDARTAQPAEPA